jgi:hypothetical protein
MISARLYVLLLGVSLLSGGCMGQKAAEEPSTIMRTPTETQVPQEQAIHDLGIEKFSIPEYAMVGQEIELVTKIINQGTDDESTVLYYYANGAEILDCRKNITVEGGTGTEDVCKWTPKEASTYMIKARIDPVAGEILMENNEVPKILGIGSTQPTAVPPLTLPPITAPPSGMMLPSEMDDVSVYDFIMPSNIDRSSKI